MRPRLSKLPCPKCGRSGSRSTHNITKPDQYIRYRTCVKCGHKFKTTSDSRMGAEKILTATKCLATTG